MSGSVTKFLNFKLRDLDFDRPISLKIAVLVIVTAAISLIIGWLWLGSYFFGPSKTSYYDNRIQELKEILREHPDNRGTALELAMTLYLKGDEVKGITLARQVLTKYPDDPNALFNLGLMLSDRRDYGESIQLLEKITKQHPGFEAARVSFYLGKNYLESGNFRKANTILEDAVKLDRGSPVAYYYLGRAKEGIGNREKALEAYKQAVLLAGTYPEAEASIHRLTRRLSNGQDN